MTTYHTYDIDSVPAPSDFELEVLDRRTQQRRASDREVARLTGQTIAEYDADTTAPDPVDCQQAIDLLSQSYFLVNECPCDFSNGVVYQCEDEGEVKANALLDGVRDFLRAHGDEYASQEVEL